VDSGLDGVVAAMACVLLLVEVAGGRKHGQGMLIVIRITQNTQAYRQKDQ
jgi:hypothetical protein